MSTPAITPLAPDAVNLAQWLAVLQRWVPCQQAVLVGPQAAALAPPALPKLPSIRYVTDWVAQHNGPATWHHASLPAESGLLPAESLRSAWPSIKTVKHEQVQAQCLDTLLRTLDANLPVLLWVQSLPALALLKGGQQTLAGANVVLARVMLANSSPPEAGLADLQLWMAQQGFQFAGVQPERNPALGTALFVRDHAKALLAQLQEAQQKLQQQTLASQALQAKIDAETQALAESRAQAQQLSADKAALQAQKDAEAKAKTEAQQKLAAETQAKAQLQQDLQAKIEAEAKAHAQLQEAHQKLQQQTIASQALQAKIDAETKALAESRVQAQQLSADKAALEAQKDAEAKVKAEALTARDAQAKVAAERQAALEVASKAQADLQQKLQQETQAKQALQASLDQETKAKSDLQIAFTKEVAARKTLDGKIIELKENIASLQNQKRLLDQENKNFSEQHAGIKAELIKAEAHVELIKDLLIQLKIK